MIAEPDLAQGSRTSGRLSGGVSTRHPLLLMLQGAAASQPDAVAILAEFDDRRLDAAANMCGAQPLQASWRSVRRSAEVRRSALRDRHAGGTPARPGR